LLQTVPLTPARSPYIKKSMNALSRVLTILSAVLFLTPSTSWADPGSFPSNGLDAQSLGRGGTVIASPSGVWSVFGNPATLTPQGYYILGLDYLDQRGAQDKSWSLTVVDTNASIRGALSYFKDPGFAGFLDKMWGVSLSQTLMPSLYLGESFHMGEYEPESSPGSEERLSTVDAGLLYKLGSKVSIGYVAHNLFPNNQDLLKRYNGFGIGLQFPMTISFMADYEEVPDSGSDMDLRAGIEFKPVKKITGRLGYQDLANGSTYMTGGITYTDINGTLDAAILYDDRTNKTERVILGLSIRM